MAEKTEADDERIHKYRLALRGVVTAAHMLAGHDIPGLIEAIERAHTTGPILDPTLYRDKAKAMDEDAELLRAALPLWKLTRERARKLAEAREKAG
jgi:pyrimidine operon attenuation protein/uracil phosphoribosyltransferase